MHGIRRFGIRNGMAFHQPISQIRHFDNRSIYAKNARKTLHVILSHSACGGQSHPAKSRCRDWTLGPAPSANAEPAEHDAEPRSARGRRRGKALRADGRAHGSARNLKFSSATSARPLLDLCVPPEAGNHTSTRHGQPLPPRVGHEGHAGLGWRHEGRHDLCEPALRGGRPRPEPLHAPLPAQFRRHALRLPPPGAGTPLRVVRSVGPPSGGAMETSRPTGPRWRGCSRGSGRRRGT